MPWSEEQKRVGRFELRRRRSTETPSSRRAAFLEAMFIATGAAVLSCILIWSAMHGNGTSIRVVGAMSALIAVTLMLFALLLTYVRFLDWRRGAKTKA